MSSVYKMSHRGDQVLETGSKETAIFAAVCVTQVQGSRFALMANVNIDFLRTEFPRKSWSFIFFYSVIKIQCKAV